jgi:hypothetical protein
MTDKEIPVGGEPEIDPSEIEAAGDESASPNGEQLEPTHPWMRVNALESRRDHNRSKQI